MWYKEQGVHGLNKKELGILVIWSVNNKDTI